MSLASYIFSVLAALLMLAYVIEMLRKRRLRERHALWWLVVGVLALIAALFPSLLEATSRALGIVLPLSLVLFVGIVVLFLVSVQQAAELTRLEERTRTLAEQHALLELRLRALEEPQHSTETPPTLDPEQED